MRIRLASQCVALFATLASLALGGLAIAERLFWRWSQGVKVGESTNDWPFISIGSFWLSVPWFLVTVLLALFAWDPTSARWVRRGLVLLAVVEAAAIWWMASAGLRPDPR